METNISNLLRDVNLLYLEARNIQNLLHESFELQLDSLLSLRMGELSSDEESTRQAVREMLRFGKYKPTGRGKPASEYLLRCAQNHAFPRINAAVDICNFISLKYLVPISLWDLDLSESSQFIFRCGKVGESYVFNTAAQSIDLEDLICGFSVNQTGIETPIVNPVKDSLRTKTSKASRNIGTIVYLPTRFKETEKLADEYQFWLSQISDRCISCNIFT